MSAWFYEPSLPSNFRGAGGVAGLGEIANAATKQMQMVDNTNGSYQALYAAYDRRIADIRTATGQAIENPLKIAERLDAPQIQAQKDPLWKQDIYAPMKMGPAMPTNMQKERQKFSEWLAQMQEQHPDAKASIRADVPLERDAEAIAKKSVEDHDRLLGSRGGVSGYTASIAGGFKGSLYDPIQVAALFAGGGAGAGRTLIARLANVALKEALVNGVTEAAFQPQVQEWRGKAGLPHGFKEAAWNVIFASVAGGVFGAAGEAVSAGARRVFKGKWLEDAADHAVKTAPLTPEVKAGLAGDTAKAIETLKPIRDALPPEARAAIDHHETMSVHTLPDAPTQHKTAAASMKVAADPHASFTPEIDPAKVDRITRELVPDAPIARKSEQRGLADFLVRAGGIRDEKGEITAIGLQSHSERFKGRLVNEKGRSLDKAREVAAEAGYFDHLYGSPENAMEKSTVGDLLDELDTEARRSPNSQIEDGGRSYVAGKVDELLRTVGPDVDDKLVADAVKLAETENIDLVQAFDRVALDHETALDLHAAADSDLRQDPELFHGESREPEAPFDDELLTADDLADIDLEADIPFFDDGRAATTSEILESLDELDGLFELTRACKA